MRLLGRRHRRTPRRATRALAIGAAALCGLLAAGLLATPGTLARLWPSGRLAPGGAWALPQRAGARAAPGAGQHQYWQVGLNSGPEASDATGMRTTIVTRLPQRVAPNTTNYYWIGSYLADGSFIQVGYYVPWYDARSAGWFYCAFTPDQGQGPCVFGPDGSAGADGAAHRYTLEVSAAPADAAGAGAAPGVWSARVDGVEVGRFRWSSDTTGPNTPGIFAESSGFAPHPATSRLGPVDFPSPVETRGAGGPGYVAARHLQPVYDGGDICPPYGASADGDGGALLGSGLPCPSPDAWLW